MNTVTLTSKEGKITVPDPDVLFQRLLSSTLLGKDTLTIEEVLEYELCPFPPALFDSPDLLKTANKADLAHAIEEMVVPVQSTLSSCNISTTPHYIIDGGMLLQKLKWSKGTTFAEICEPYVRYLQSISRQNVTVVFDGYCTSSTKDMVHRRRKRHYSLLYRHCAQHGQKVDCKKGAVFE